MNCAATEDAAMPTETLVAIIGVVGVAVGALLTHFTGMRQKNIDVALAVEMASKQVYGQMAAERDRQRQQKIEEAYGHLNEWLYELEEQLVHVWFGMTDGAAPATLTRAQHIIDQWPWESLRPPRKSAATQFYWSPAVWDLLRKFDGASSEFYTNANIGLKFNAGKMEGDDTAVQQYRSIVWPTRRQLLRIIKDIREQVREEMLDYWSAPLKRSIWPPVP
ncbi:hypothetical protein [Fodinicola feengrottensis]|uniref:Uncharacterized protein n=1 Tax=Fodinicola feengrottensis TaxID=435914 RepID=A0ABN2GKU6_9ACTN|nr:hypothetical protein [Fodinicola feengrottensis]